MEICISASNNLPVCSTCEYNWNTHINFTVPQKKICWTGKEGKLFQHNNEPKTGNLKIYRKTSK